MVARAADHVVVPLLDAENRVQFDYRRAVSSAGTAICVRSGRHGCCTADNIRSRRQARILRQGVHVLGWLNPARALIRMRLFGHLWVTATARRCSDVRPVRFAYGVPARPRRLACGHV